MRLVCISDTHGLHDEVTLPGGDVLIHAGDFTNEGELEDVRRFLSWFGSVGKFKWRVLIAGNHDLLFEYAPQVAEGLIPDHVIYLNDSGVTLDGVRFWGSPVTPYFFNWAFNRREREIERHWDLIPDDTDVLVTHGPPHLIRDGVGPQREPVGCPALARAVERVKPRLHIFGHIHEGYGSHHRQGTHFLNAAVCDADYLVTQKPVVVNL